MDSSTTMIQPDFKKLGRWVTGVREALEWSQEAVASAASVDVRTIQRLEAGNRVSSTSLRCIARGLGYEDQDVFRSERFWEQHRQIENIVAKAVEEEKAEQFRKVEEEIGPDYELIDVIVTESGRDIGRVVEGAHFRLFDTQPEVSDKAQEIAAMLFDCLADYGDADELYSHATKLQVYDQFEEMLGDLASEGCVPLIATRTKRIRNDHINAGESNWKLAIVHVVPTDRIVPKLAIPKSMHGHF